MVQPLWKIVWQLLKKLNMELPCDLVILLGVYPKYLKIGTQAGTIHKCPIHNSQKWKEPKCPPKDEWIKKTMVLYIVEYYPAVKKNEVL